MKPRHFEHRAEFRFYQELNDFLLPERRQRTLEYHFNDSPGIKDPIESFGVPHTEVDLIVVNGQSVGFDYRLKDGDRVAVYPMFESFDISPLVRLRERPLRQVAFVLDVNLGKLAKRLRLLGFDTLYSNAYTDADVADIAATQRRIVLTRDRRLLFARRITHGYWVRSVRVDDQVDEVLQRFDLHRLIQPFERCLICNGQLEEVPKAHVLESLEPKTRLYYEDFYRCSDCGRVYWEGSHVQHMRRWFQHRIPPSATS